MRLAWAGRLALLLAVALCALGQDAKKLAGLALADLSEMRVVSAARHDQNWMDSPRAVSVITGEEIRRRGYRNVPEALAGLAGVYLQQTNYGGGSPILRGMVGNRILLMVNGIRMNNAIYRLGPNQYLNFVDIRRVERIEVVRGAGSVLYGSDAFGGIVNVITRLAPDPRMGPEFSGGVRLRSSSADASGAGRAQFSLAAGRLGLAGGASAEAFGDLRAGGAVGVQEFTSYRQAAGDLAFQAVLGKGRTLSGGLSRIKQSGVPRTDVLRARTDLTHEWNPQGRDAAYVRYEDDQPLRYVDALQITAVWQRPFEYLNRVTASAPLQEQFLADEVKSVNLGIQLTSAAGPAHVLTYGLDANADRVASSRTDLNLATGARVSKLGNYANGARFSSFGAYVQDEVRLARQLDAVLGGRFDTFHLRADVADAYAGRQEIDASPSALTGSAHLLYRVAPRVALVLGVSQGFRAPNVDDSTILGGSSRYEIPNGGLQPERSVNVEYGARVRGRSGHAAVMLFEDRYRNLIDRVPALLNGRSWADLNGNGVRDGSEPLVFQRRNLARVLARGVEFDSALRLGERLAWTFNGAWTRADVTSQAAPLSRIPPLNGATRLQWQASNSMWVEFSALAATGQRRLSPGDLADIRIGPGGTPGFATFDVRAGWKRHYLSGLSIGLENLTDRRYRFHGSGFDRPGINLVVAYNRDF